MVDIGNNVVAVSSTFGADDAGHIFFLDISDPMNPAVLAEEFTNYRPTGLEANGSHLLSFNTQDGAAAAVVVYDVADPSSPAEISRLPVIVPDEHHIYRIASQGANLVVVSLAFGAGTSRVTWLELVPNFTSASPVATSDDHAAGAAFIKLHDDYALVDDSVNAQTLVLALDRPTSSLLDHFRVDLRDSVYVAHRDSSRGLFYVGGDSIQILDLGVITDGVPRWP